MGSSALKDNQKRWTVNELETLAVAYACKQAKFFITNHPGDIIINTDNATICRMFKKDFTKIENPRISKLFKDIAHFNVVLQHTSRKENLVADTLSRNTDTDIPDVDAPNLEM